MKQVEPDMAITVEPIAVSAKKAGQLLSVSERTIREWAANTDLPTLKVKGRTLYPVEGLRRWANEHTGNPVEW
ncbi:MAG: helix-turn-helix domain-containing protein [Clostridiales bacterium]|nr:helix-turn-helix domain-containing protein [Clostridiales bacterium]